jgi:hypothetical protein
MADIKKIFEEDVEALRRLRDEIEVQAHLGRVEVREKWEEVERAWQRLEGEVEHIRREAKEPLESIESAGRLLMDEIRSGYAKLRDLIQ